MNIPLAKNGSPDYCIDCISKMTIRCAWCGKPIIIGDPVTLYRPIHPYNIPSYAIKHNHNGSQTLVGCLRLSCADTKDDIVGFWAPGENDQGEVKYITSIYETLLSKLELSSSRPSQILNRVLFKIE